MKRWFLKIQEEISVSDKLIYKSGVYMQSLLASQRSLVQSQLKNSEYDQEIPQSHTADQPTAP